MKTGLHKWLLVAVILLPTTLSAEPTDRLVAPAEPVELRFSFDEPIRYDVRTKLGMEYAEQPELEPNYQSTMTVEYRHFPRQSRDLMPHWPMHIEALADESPRGTPVVATISEFSGAFDSPDELTESANHYQLLSDAVFSYRLTPRGTVTDVRVHPPTNPQARASVEELVRLLAMSHPALPEEAVEPGDRWSDQIDLTAEDGVVEQHLDLKLDYHFKEWTRCEQAFCAVIDIDQKMTARGQFAAGHLQTDSDATGSGKGRIVFNPSAGKIVESSWDIDVQGSTQTERRDGDMSEIVVDFDYDLAAHTAFDLSGSEQ